MLSVVIPSYNARPELELLLCSLEQQELDPRTFEVIVVDDGSDDGTGAMVERFHERLDLRYHFKERTPTSGRSAARNTGIAIARGSVVVMVDADQVVPPRFLAEHLGYHQRRDDLVVVGPRAELHPEAVDLVRRSRCANVDFSSLRVLDETESRDDAMAVLSYNMNNLATCWHFLFSCNVSVGREHLTAVGGFDECFTGWGLEDSELGYRLRKRGLLFAYNPAAILYHLEEQAWDESMYHSWLENLARFSAKHDDPEVAAQWVLDRSYRFDPSGRDLTWLESYLRFEHAVRALQGRYPQAEPYQLIEARGGDTEQVMSAVAEHVRKSPVIVVDHLGDPELAAFVQCTDTPHELLYFRRPDTVEMSRIRATYRLVG